MPNLKNEIEHEIKAIAGESGRVLEQLEKEAISSFADIDRLNTLLSETIGYMEKNYRKTVGVREKINIQLNDTYDFLPIPPLLTIIKEENMYHFKLSEQLPHRITIDKYAKSLKYDYNPSIYYSGYRMAVERYLKNNPITAFREKALLYVKTHCSSNHMLDNDNIELKTFIDAVIKGVFIKDDSPEFLSIYLDAVNDGADFTELYLGNPKDMLHLLSNS